ncbi:MAG: NYN domain-containing protein [Phycisphaerae bacterium]
MPVLIDGNNLLYAARDARMSGPLPGRSILCNLVGEWARRRGQRVHVVFDGPEPDRGLAKQIGNSAIQVTYSGRRTADAELIDLLDEDSAARRLLVVSSDREIARAAGRHRARSIRSDEFWALLEQDLSRPLPRRVEPEEKRQGLSPGATDEWMREFGFDAVDRGAGDGAAPEERRPRS